MITRVQVRRPRASRRAGSRRGPAGAGRTTCASARSGRSRTATKATISADVDARARDRWAASCRTAGRASAGRRDRRILERPLDQDVREVDPDERHHQRRDDLVRAVARLEDRGDDRPGGADRRRDRRTARGSRAASACCSIRAARARDQRGAEQELAVVAEVPDVGAEDRRSARRRSAAAAPCGSRCPAMRRSRCRRARRRGRTGTGCARARAAAARRRRARGSTGSDRARPDVDACARPRGPAPDAGGRRTPSSSRWRWLAGAVTSRGLRRRRRRPSGAPIRSAAPGPFSITPDEAPTREHGDPVADLEQLVEVGRDHERSALPSRASSRIASRTARVVLQVEPVGGLVEDDDAAGRTTARARAAASGCCRPTACRRASSGPACGRRSSRTRSRRHRARPRRAGSARTARTAAGRCASGTG